MSGSSPYGSDLAGFLAEQFKQFEENRKPLQLMWEDNLDAFCGRNAVTGKVGEAEGWRSNRIINITRQKVISAVSIVGDMLLQGGKIPFMLKPAPWDELVNRDAPEVQAAAKEDIEKFRKLIEQQLTECNADRHMIRNIMSAALYGETYAKLRLREYVRKVWRQSPLQVEGIVDYSRIPQQMLQWQQVEHVVSAPAVEYCSRWDIFDDVEERNPQEGRGIYHRRFVSPAWMLKRVKSPVYFGDEIKLAIAAAPAAGTSSSVPAGQSTDSFPPWQRQLRFRTKTIRYLEYWGQVPTQLFVDYMQGRGVTLQGIPEEITDADAVEVLACMADDKVVRCELSDMSRPFFKMYWQDQEDELGGVGVAQMVQNAQDMLNWSVRAYEDNKKLSANITMAVKRRFLVRGDVESIAPGDKIDISDDCDDVRKAIQQVVIQDVGEQLQNLIQLAEKYADKDSLIPALQQGQDVKEPQMRAFVAARQLEQAGKYIGSVIRNCDDGLIEPIVGAFYDYNMNDPDLPINKGSYVVTALGFTSFQDRVERITKLQQNLQLILSSPLLIAESKLRWYLEEIAKALDLDPDQCLKSPEDKAAEQQQALQLAAVQGAGQASPPDPLLQEQRQKLQADAAHTMAKSEAVKTDALIKKAKAVTAVTGRAQPADVAAPQLSQKI